MGEEGNFLGHKSCDYACDVLFDLEAYFPYDYLLWHRNCDIERTFSRLDLPICPLWPVFLLRL